MSGRKDFLPTRSKNKNKKNNNDDDDNGDDDPPMLTRKFSQVLPSRSLKNTSLLSTTTQEFIAHRSDPREESVISSILSGAGHNFDENEGYDDDIDNSNDNSNNNHNIVVHHQRMPTKVTPTSSIKQGVKDSSSSGGGNNKNNNDSSNVQSKQSLETYIPSKYTSPSNKSSSSTKAVSKTENSPSTSSSSLSNTKKKSTFQPNLYTPPESSSSSSPSLKKKSSKTKASPSSSRAKPKKSNQDSEHEIFFEDNQSIGSSESHYSGSDDDENENDNMMPFNRRKESFDTLEEELSVLSALSASTPPPPRPPPSSSSSSQQPPPPPPPSSVYDDYDSDNSDGDWSRPQDALPGHLFDASPLPHHRTYHHHSDQPFVPIGNNNDDNFLSPDQLGEITTYNPHKQTKADLDDSVLSNPQAWSDDNYLMPPDLSSDNGNDDNDNKIYVPAVRKQDVEAPSVRPSYRKVEYHLSGEIPMHVYEATERITPKEQIQSIISNQEADSSYLSKKWAQLFAKVRGRQQSQQDDDDDNDDHVDDYVGEDTQGFKFSKYSSSATTNKTKTTSTTSHSEWEDDPWLVQARSFIKRKSNSNIPPYDTNDDLESLYNPKTSPRYAIWRSAFSSSGGGGDVWDDEPETPPSYWEIAKYYWKHIILIILICAVISAIVVVLLLQVNNDTTNNNNNNVSKINHRLLSPKNNNIEFAFESEGIEHTTIQYS